MSSIRNLSEALSSAVSGAEASIVTLHRARCGGGSAIAWTKDLVVTAAHQLDREEGIEVTVRGQRASATLVGVDAGTDLAVLRVEGAQGSANPLSPLANADASALRVGELVLALARPSGDGVRARLGIVSRLGGEWRLPGGARFDRYVESDVTPAPGFSGGALVNASGELIGLNSAGIVRGSLVTLAASGVAKVVDALVAHGRVRRAQLGVSVQRVALPRELAAARGQNFGLIVLSVMSGSAAADGGVRLGDVLLAIGGNRLQRVEDLQGALDADKIDQDVDLELLRAGDEQRILVKPGVRG